LCARTALKGYLTGGIIDRINAFLKFLKGQTPSKRHTNCPSVRSSDRSFVVRLFVRCVCQGRPSYGQTNRDTS